jgi:hypothetical protein
MIQTSLTTPGKARNVSCRNCPAFCKEFTHGSEISDPRFILDATAGNRHMWKKNKHPSGVVFLDKEPNLRIPPDIIATWDNIPCDDDEYKCILFDPPHVCSLTSMWNKNPQAIPNGSKKAPSWYGAFESRAHALEQIHGAQIEFSRVAPVICFKWNEASIPLKDVLEQFDRWDVQTISQRKNLRSSKTYWAQLTRKEQTK